MFIKLTGKQFKTYRWVDTDKIIYFEPYLGNTNDGTTLRFVDGTVLYVIEHPEEVCKLLEEKK